MPFCQKNTIQDFETSGQTPKGVRHSIIVAILPENCMKLKKIGSEGGHASPAPTLDPLMMHMTQSHRS